MEEEIKEKPRKIIFPQDLKQQREELKPRWRKFLVTQEALQKNLRTRKQKRKGVPEIFSTTVATTKEGRRSWRITENLYQNLTPIFMKKMREKAQTAFYLRHSFSYWLVHIETGQSLYMYKNAGSPWI